MRINCAATYVALLLGSLPLVSAYALFAQNDRYLMQNELQKALHEAAGHYNEKTYQQAQQHKTKEEIEAIEDRLPKVTRQKTLVRRRLVKVRRQISTLETELDVRIGSDAQIETRRIDTKTFEQYIQ